MQRRWARYSPGFDFPVDEAPVYRSPIALGGFLTYVVH